MKFDANGWLDVAQKVDYSANSMSRQGYGIKYLCLHGTAGGTSAQGVGQFFQGTIGSSNPVSSHIIIDQQGDVVQGVSLKDAAFGNGVITNGHAAWLPDPSINPNWYTASIEFVKASTDNSDALTAIQFQKGCEVIECICNTYNIPKRAGDVNGGIIKHADIDPISRARCPGTFDWTSLYNYLNGGNKPMPTTPQGWSDDGHTLKAPNGIPVVLGFRDKVLNSNWDPANWPMRAEYHADPVEQSHPSLGAGPAQEFRWDRLAGCASLGIYKTWLGQELYWYQKQYDLLVAQVADLQEKLAELQPDALVAENAALKAQIAQAVKVLL
ncbi:MAG TPA: N-acetylmuramoyl-L-alanine amidase [Ktedonobacteraceae bacterium]|jgi:N-acetyl-anhydromuramyl-L-alanine amidase AmpD|nr:N-acetylmuramoyl-L-alanine amidase [Ktedonobacteraceae bacterium]